MLQSNARHYFLLQKKPLRFIFVPKGDFQKLFAMKKIYLLLFGLSFAGPMVHGKTTTTGIPNMFPHMGSSGSGNSVAASNSRIVGYTFLKHDGSAFVPVDSTTYSYSFGRGGQLSREEMDDNFVSFDDSYTYLYLPSSNSYRNQFHRFQTFNGAGKVSKYNCQSWQMSSQSWRDSSRFVYTYNNDLTRLIKTSFDIYYYSTNIWSPHVYYNNVYDNAGNMLAMRSNVFTMTFTYDGSNNMLSRIDSQVNMAPFQWYAKQKLLFSYDASNRLTSFIEQHFVSGGWEHYAKFEHVYTGNNITETTEYRWLNNSWEVNSKHLLSYDQHNNIVSDVLQHWDAGNSVYNNVSRRMWTYNLAHQPVTYYSETFELSTNLWRSAADDFLFRYYYQSYIPASISKLPSEDDLKLFPIPASDKLSVSLDMAAAKTGSP